MSTATFPGSRHYTLTAILSHMCQAWNISDTYAHSQLETRYWAVIRVQTHASVIWSETAKCEIFTSL
jgi:hypothetical protein